MAVDDSYTVVQDHPLLVSAAQGVLANDSNPDGGLMWAVFDPNGPPTQGTVTLQNDGSFSYMPPMGFVGVTSFQYFACNTYGPSAITATVTLTVTVPPPVANDDNFFVLHDHSIDAPVLANDISSSGAALTPIIVQGPQHGTASVNSNGTIHYAPAAGYVGQDTLKYKDNDGAQDSNVANVNINVTNQAPTAVSAVDTVVHDHLLTIDVWAIASDADGDPLTVTVVQSPQYGTVTNNGDGTLDYSPNTGFVGLDMLTFKVNDGVVDSNTATLTINVTDVPPVAEPEEFDLHAGNLLKLDSTDGLLHDASDADGDAMTVQLVGPGPSNGSLNLQSDGSLMYVAKDGFIGDDSFSYRLFDGILYSATQQVTIHVADQAPIVSPIAFDVWTSQGISGGADNVLANATDPDGDSMKAFLLTGPQYAASFHLNDDGTFTYIPMSSPPMGFNGVDSFVVDASDGTMATPETVTLNWTTQPVAKDCCYVLDSSGQLILSAADGVLARIFNPMNAQVAAQVVDNIDPSIGALDFRSDGSFDFTAGPGFQDEADFTFGLVVGGVQINPPATVRIVANWLLAGSTGLFSVAFNGNATLAKDNLVHIEPPQWVADQSTDANAPEREVRNPISFTRNSTIPLIPTFNIATPTFLWRALGNNILVRAASNILDGQGQPLQLGFNQNVHLQLIGNELTTQGWVWMDSALANSTAYQASFELTWQISPDNGRTWITPTYRFPASAQTVANVSRDPLFVTLAHPNGWDPSPEGVAGLATLNGWTTPLASVTAAIALAPEKANIPWTVFYIGAEGQEFGETCLEATTTATLVADVWSGFETRRITKVDGTPLTYWKVWSPEPRTTAGGLLFTSDGSCKAWSELFIDVLRAWGANVSNQSNVKAILPDQRNSPVRANGFLVKDWAFGNQNVMFAPPQRLAGYRWSNQLGAPDFVQTPAGWQFNWQGQPAVTYLGGAAQNNQNPKGLFDDHVIVRIGNILYDPSYGVTYQSNIADPTDEDLLHAFQAQALAGYYWTADLRTIFLQPVTGPNAPNVRLMFRNFNA